ncbi:MAG: hypothetical protein IPF54_27925 [Draconibacterium sp.]|nr:hypothetical protein [Draconibacterium sp.]
MTDAVFAQVLNNQHEKALAMKYTSNPELSELMKRTGRICFGRKTGCFNC